MKSKLLFILILISLIVIGAPAGFVHAETATSTTEYILLEPINTPASSGQLTTIDVGQTSALGEYLNLMIKIVIGLAAVLAVVMIVIGGIEYMTSELMSSKEAGRDRMTGAVFGLLIALGAYALLYTINPNLLNTDITIGQATLLVSVDTPQTAVNGQYNSVNNTFPTGANWATIAGAQTPLPPGVTPNKGECTTVGQQNCTSTRGLNVIYIKTTQQGCNCPLVISGGTESWLHSAGTAHEPGSPVVDLITTSALTSYIIGGNTQPIPGKRYMQGGVSYLYEVSHWHVGG